MIRVFLVDDHAIVRDGLRAVLTATGDIEVVGEARTGEAVLAAAAAPGAATWDVLLLDLALPDASGLSVLRQLRELRPRLQVLVLTMHPEDQYAVRVLRAGAAGFINKGRPGATLIAAIRELAAGRRYITPELSDLMLQTMSNIRAPAASHDELTTRELEILIHVGQGCSTSEIAQLLGLSASTVSTHLGRIKERLGLTSTSQLAQYALKAGLIHWDGTSVGRK